MGISFAVSRATANQLYGITPTDALTFTAVPLILVLVSLATILLPLRRACRIEPMTALRQE